MGESSILVEYDMMFSQLKIGNVQKGIKEVVKCQKVAKYDTIAVKGQFPHGQDKKNNYFSKF
jgi:hypothetical protein